MKTVLLAEFGGELGLEYLKALLGNDIPLEAIIFIGETIDHVIAGRARQIGCI